MLMIQHPIVGIRTATKGDDPDVNSGAVARLATDEEEVSTTGSGGTDAVVTADQLRATNIAVLTAGGVSTGGLIWSRQLVLISSNWC